MVSSAPGAAAPGGGGAHGGGAAAPPAASSGAASGAPRQRGAQHGAAPAPPPAPPAAPPARQRCRESLARCPQNLVCTLGIHGVPLMSPQQLLAWAAGIAAAASVSTFPRHAILGLQRLSLCNFPDLLLGGQQQNTGCRVCTIILRECQLPKTTERHDSAINARTRDHVGVAAGPGCSAAAAAPSPHGPEHGRATSSALASAPDASTHAQGAAGVRSCVVIPSSSPEPITSEALNWTMSRAPCTVQAFPSHIIARTEDSHRCCARGAFL